MLERVVVIINVCIMVPVAFLFVQLMSASIGGRSRRTTSSHEGDDPSVAVLIPAHDEARIIVQTLSAIVGRLGSRARVLVVADNCSDDTAALAKSCGAEVVHRQSTENVGKGFALAHGIEHLRSTGPRDTLLIIDADCNISPDSVKLLVATALKTMSPVQASYLMKAQNPTNIEERLLLFLWRLRNYIRPLGSDHLGLPCQITGSGTIIPWQLTQKFNLASNHLAEDMKMGVDLALAGYPPRFCKDAFVTSEFAPSNDGRNSQRARWQKGHIDLIRSSTAKLLASALWYRNFRLAALALDLAVLPLSILTLALGASLLLGLLTAVVSGESGGASVAMIGIAMYLFALFIAWLRHGRDLISGRDLLKVIALVVTKILSISVLSLQRRKGWVRAERKSLGD